MDYKQQMEGEKMCYGTVGEEMEPWETGIEWRHKVCEPIIEHRLTPRDARAILEKFGQMADRGFDIYKLLTKIGEV